MPKPVNKNILQTFLFNQGIKALASDEGVSPFEAQRSNPNAVRRAGARRFAGSIALATGITLSVIGGIAGVENALDHEASRRLEVERDGSTDKAPELLIDPTEVNPAENMHVTEEGLLKPLDEE